MAKDGETNDDCALEHEGRGERAGLPTCGQYADGRWMWDNKECEQGSDHFLMSSSVSTVALDNAVDISRKCRLFLALL